MLNRFNQPSTRCTAIAIFVLTIWTLGCWSAKSKSLLSPDCKYYRYLLGLKTFVHSRLVTGVTNTRSRLSL